MSSPINLDWTDSLADAEPLSEEALMSFESLIGSSLPETYKGLLRQQNGGSLNKCEFQLDMGRYSETPIIDPLYFVGDASNPSSYNLRHVYTSWCRGGGAPNCVPIGSDGMGGSILIDIDSGTDGTVYMCFAGSRELHKVAQSFVEFLSMLKEPTIDED